VEATGRGTEMEQIDIRPVERDEVEMDSSELSG
jgi:hypothetical protein